MGMSGDFEIAIEEWRHGSTCRPGDEFHLSTILAGMPQT